MEYHEQQWREQAACRSVEPDLFFHPDKSVATRSAKAVCHTCPVLEPCREWALQVRLPIGVAGALTPPEREAILKERDVA